MSDIVDILRHNAAINGGGSISVHGGLLTDAADKIESLRDETEELSDSAADLKIHRDLYHKNMWEDRNELSELRAKKADYELLSDDYRELVTDVEKLRAELSELRAAQKWQPIESAPENGEIVLMTNTYNEYALACFEYGKWVYGPEGAFSRPDHPTHWRALPEAPKPEEESGDAT